MTNMVLALPSNCRACRQVVREHASKVVAPPQGIGIVKCTLPAILRLKGGFPEQVLVQIEPHHRSRSIFIKRELVRL